ncbi:hypothetical protein IT414_03575 [bacterium]|nr:hypothetical protein [bacterium]
MKVQNKLLMQLAALFISLLVAGGYVFLILFGTTPKELGPGGVTIWFIGLFVFLASLAALIGYGLRFRKPANQDKLSKLLSGSLRTGVIISLGVTVLLALKSLGSLNMRDIVLFVLTLVVVELYFRTRRAY